MPSTRHLGLAATLVAALAATPSAQAEQIYGLTDGANPTLVTFDSATPWDLSVVAPVSGVIDGLMLRSIDFRPADGLLYGLATSGPRGQLYSIDIHNGIASTVGRGFSFDGVPSSRISIDFNPVVDRLRVVAGSGDSYRVNPNTGALAAHDVSVATEIRGLAYSNNYAGATSTTLYAYDYSWGTLVTIGGANGSPSPNLGVVFDVGDTAITPYSTTPVGLDIGRTGNAYWSIDRMDSSNFNTEFHSMNLATGWATKLGEVPVALLDIAVSPVPEPVSLALWLGGLGLLGRTLRRRER